MRLNEQLPIDATLEQATRAVVGMPAESGKPVAQYVKSPLRYPGGKSRAVKQIIELMPPGLDSLCSPFFGGGSVELACANAGMQVHGYDLFKPLVNFWQVALEDAPKLAKMVYDYYPLTKTQFYALQKRYFDICDRLERATAFYTLNRTSYSGTTLSGGMSPGHPRFTESAINRLADFTSEGLTVEVADFKESIPAHPDTFMYLDPPYANGEALYGSKGDMHKDFDHLALADLLKDRRGWILSYNDCHEIRKLYEGHAFVEPDWIYGMNNNRYASSEVLILSKDYVRVS